MKASKVQQRLRVMYLAMCSYYRMKPSEEDKPFAREIPLYLEGSAVDDLVGGAEPISGTAEWAGKSFGESGSVSEASDRSLGDIGFVSETAESESGFGTEPLGEGSQTEPAEESIGEQSSAEDSKVNQCDSGSDVQSEESTENSDEVPQPCLGGDSDVEQEESVRHRDDEFDSILESDIAVIGKKLIPLMSVSRIEGRNVFVMTGADILPEYEGER